jgi:hypothetical protein
MEEYYRTMRAKTEANALHRVERIALFHYRFKSKQDLIFASAESSLHNTDKSLERINRCASNKPTGESILLSTALPNHPDMYMIQ